VSKLNTHPAAHLSDLADYPEVLARLSVHAEHDALKRCGNPRGATIAVARIGKNGKIGLAKPCDRCQHLLTEAQVKKVIYTINENEHGVWTP